MVTALLGRAVGSVRVVAQPAIGLAMQSLRTDPACSCVRPVTAGAGGGRGLRIAAEPRGKAVAMDAAVRIAQRRIVAGPRRLLERCANGLGPMKALVDMAARA
jgi:hypothetical protein